MKPVLILALTSALLGQQPQQANSIEGVVVRSDTGQPVPGAQVTLSSSSFPEGQVASVATLRGGFIQRIFPPAIGRLPAVNAGADGAFQFKDLKPGTYRITVKAPGFVDQDRKPLNLADGQALRSVAVRVIPENTVSGRVFDEKGQPATGAAVELLRAVYGEEGKGYRLVQQVAVDDQGRYRLFGLAPGQYYIGAGTFMSQWQQRAPTSLYADVYYPRAESLDTATPIAVRAERETFLDLITVRQKAEPHGLRGRVIDGVTGQPPAAVDLSLLVTSFVGGGSRGGYRNSYDAATGTFDLQGVYPGNYDLLVALPFRPTQSVSLELDYAPWRRTVQYIEVRDADIEGLVFTIGPSNSGKGRFVLEGGEAAAVTGIEHAKLAMIRKGIASNDPALVLPTASDGSFELQALRDADYRVTVSGVPDDFYVKSINYGGEEITANSIKIADPLKGSIDVTLGRAVPVSGIVRDAAGQPVSAAQVVLLAVERGKSRDVVGLTDLSGRFRLPNVAPGEYRLYAWDRVDEGTYYDPEFMKPYADKGLAVRAVEGANQNLDVKLGEP